MAKAIRKTKTKGVVKLTLSAKEAGIVLAFLGTGAATDKNQGIYKALHDATPEEERYSFTLTDSTGVPAPTLYVNRML